MINTVSEWREAAFTFRHGVWGNLADIVPDDDVGSAIIVDATLSEQLLRAAGFQTVAFRVERPEGSSVISWSQTLAFRGAEA